MPAAPLTVWQAIRSFRIPDNINAEKIEASFKNGVLKLTLPKKPEAQKNKKKIAIKTG